MADENTDENDLSDLLIKTKQGIISAKLDNSKRMVVMDGLREIADEMSRYIMEVRNAAEFSKLQEEYDLYYLCNVKPDNSRFDNFVDLRWAWADFDKLASDPALKIVSQQDLIEKVSWTHNLDTVLDYETFFGPAVMIFALIYEASDAISGEGERKILFYSADVTSAPPNECYIMAKKTKMIETVKQ